jgi:hypothetical protein
VKTIWIEGIEISGLINNLAIGFKEKGYRVYTCVDNYSKDNYVYDINKYRFVRDLIDLKLLRYPKISKIAIIFINKYLPKLRSKFLRKIQLKLFEKQVDYYLPVYTSQFIRETDFYKIKNNKKTKIIGYFIGSEIRVYKTFCTQFDINPNVLGGEYLNESIKEKIEKLKYFEKYAHCIFSVPDQMSFANHPYFHLQLPFVISNFKFNQNQNKIPLIIHCPSNSNIKGSDIIIKAVNELKEEGVKFNFIYLQKIPHAELLLKLSEADILIDELYAHGPGLLSFEAMASGCIALTRYYEESPQCFKPPIVSITKNNIKEKLKNIILDVELRKELCLKARNYVVENNSLSKVVDDMIKIFENVKLNDFGFDYYPNFKLIEKEFIDTDTKLLLKNININ